MNTRVLTLLITFVFLGVSGPLGAHACKHDPDNPDHAHCSDSPKGNPDSESNDKVFPVKVTFADDFSDTIQSNGGPYIDSVNVTAEVPEEGSPPGQFILWMGDSNNFSSTLFMDFGDAVDCDSPFDPDSEGECVWENAADPYNEFHPVLCPFKLGEREPNETKCSGFKPVQLAFRHTVDGNNTPDQFMYGMDTDVTVNGEAGDAEFQFRAEKNVGGWRLRFVEDCLGEGVGEYLEIEATDTDKKDEILNEYWRIGTGDGMKTACLTKTGKGKSEDLSGLFDMQFEYTICILADPDSGTGACLVEPP